jgi:23S rRNA (cytosine1962-C5)-methyltransferase
MPVVYLRKGNLSRLARGHPWIYSNEIAKVTGEPRDGEVVKVSDYRQRPLGCGFYNTRSQIVVRRVAQRGSVEVNPHFFHKRIEAAWELRRRLLREVTCCRVVNSEADFLPGLIVEKYGDRVVLQTLTLGMDLRKKEILEALEAILHPAAIVERNDAPVRKLEGLEQVKAVLKGAEADARFETIFGGLKFEVDLLEGHKGGLYLDQRTNHQAVAQCATGRRVLDAFSYEGGFALQCAAHGAKSVTAVEISESAAKRVGENATRNGLEAAVNVLCQNAFDFLKNADALQNAPRPDNAERVKRSDAPYDMVILDPPSFTRNKDSLPDALRGYKEINLRACKLLTEGGMLATFCCSHHVPRELFLDVILDAATDAQRTLRQVASLGQSPDHPILPAVPETEYLKGFIFEVL